jgi:hypothetical protein
MENPIDRPGETPTTTSCRCGSWWQLPLVLGLVLAAIIAFGNRGIRVGPQDAGEGDAPASTAAGERVSLSIEAGDLRKPTTGSFAWRKGMTVRDLTHAVPGIAIEQQGSGASAFLTSIDGLTNEGAGRRNWMYSVNGQRGDRSYAIYKLEAGDRVLWSFEPPE